MNKNKFRINAKNLLLTYPQVKPEITRQMVLSELLTKERLNIKNYLIAKEIHKDEGIHYHVYLELEKRCDIKNSNYLDILNNHGRYERVNSRVSTINYLLKEDENHLTNMLFETYNNKLVSPEEWAIHRSKDIGVKKTLLEYIEKYPERVTTYLTKLEKTLILIDKLQQQKEESQLKNFDIIPFENLNWNHLEQAQDLNEWIQSERKETLVLTGGSGTGKTVWALSYCSKEKKNTLYMTDFEGFKELSINHDSWILDDSNLHNISKITTEAITKLLDNSTSTDLRLLGKSLKRPANLTQIIITNNLKTVLKRGQKRILRRIRIINFDKPIIFNINVENNYYLNNPVRDEKNKELWLQQQNISEKDLLEEVSKKPKE